MDSNSLQGRMKRRLVRIVGTLRRELDLEQRKTESLDLGSEQGTAHAVNAYAIVFAGDARKETSYLDHRIAAERLKRECAVLPAAPAEDDLPWRLRSYSLGDGGFSR